MIVDWISQSMTLGSVGGDDTREFSFENIRRATDDFSNKFLLRKGSFGRVYKLRRRNGQLVTVRILPDDSRPEEEFKAEVDMLRQLDHPNLVKLINYRVEGVKRLLVYEYMPKTSLAFHLHGEGENLNWNTRIKIAAGAAKGLQYLHNNKPPVIYGELTPANILLDNDFQPKLSDFGLARLGKREDARRGYCAPEFLDRRGLMARYDVYALGVVLLELLSGRRALDSSRPKLERDLVYMVKKKNWKQAFRADSRLRSCYSPDGFSRVASTACLCINGRKQPALAEIVDTLSSLANNPYNPITSPDTNMILEGSEEGEEGGPSGSQQQWFGSIVLDLLGFKWFK